MTLPSLRLLGSAVYELLLGTGGLRVYLSRVEPAMPLDARGIVQGHAILNPVRPRTERTSMTGQPGSLLSEFQIDCVGGSDDYVLGVVDEVIDRVDGKTVMVVGAQVGLIQPPLGFQRQSPYRDPGATPFQIRVPLQYQILAVPA